MMHLHPTISLIIFIAFVMGFAVAIELIDYHWDEIAAWHARRRLARETNCTKPCHTRRTKRHDD